MSQPRTALFEAARSWRSGVRPEAWDPELLASFRNRPLNPFPRVNCRRDILLNLVLACTWSFFQAARLADLIRKEEPGSLPRGWVMFLLWLLTGGWYGLYLQLKFKNGIEQMRSRYGLDFNPSWLCHIVGMILFFIPPIALHFLNTRVNQSAEEWAKKGQNQRYQEVEPDTSRRRVGGALAVAMLLIAAASVFFAESDKTVELHRGERLGGIIQMEDGLLLSWIQSTRAITVSKNGWKQIQSHELQITGTPARARVLSDERVVLSSFKGELVLSTTDVRSESLSWKILNSHSISGFELLSGDRILTWSDSGEVVLFDDQGLKQFEFNGFSSKAKGVIELAGGSFLGWSKGGEIRAWTRRGRTVWTLEVEDWSPTDEEDAILSALQLSDGSVLLVSRKGRSFLLEVDPRDIHPLRPPEKLPTRYAFELRSGNIILLSQLGQIMVLDSQGELLHSSFVASKKILGAELVDAPEGGELELMVWNNSDKVVLWDPSIFSGKVIKRDFQSQDRNFRMSGALDTGGGKLIVWTTGGEILNWEF